MLHTGMDDVAATATYHSSYQRNICLISPLSPAVVEMTGSSAISAPAHGIASITAAGSAAASTDSSDVTGAQKHLVLYLLLPLLLLK